MKFSETIFRLRRWLSIAIILLGFWAPLDRMANPHPSSTWLVLSGLLAQYRVLPIGHAFIAVIALATLFALAAATLRTWGVAYLGGGVVIDRALHSERIVADGPYRYVRNPLYLGSELNILALVILMPPGGAVFTVIAITALTAVLIHAEETHLIAMKGEAYRAYMHRVPRILATPSAKILAGGEHPHWGQALLSEIYMWGVAITYVALAWRYDTTVLIQGVLISFGLSIIVRAFLPRSVTSQA
ncbi:MAG TPA: isoprenylcysteine carboxylmethyltransferase family protein [Acidobacteriaceae bacterium]|nr:isoprenylcysteine carboxylmethyltransferase family protein [Acidobacteriaceae bacterium]